MWNKPDTQGHPCMISFTGRVQNRQVHRQKVQQWLPGAGGRVWGFSFWSDEKVLELVVIDVLLCDYTKNHWSAHRQNVNFMLCEGLWKVFVCFWWDWGLNSGLWACKTGASQLKPHLQFILLWLGFGVKVWQTVCLSWPQTLILFI
jgi:hypothetical protein